MNTFEVVIRKTKDDVVCTYHYRGFCSDEGHAGFTSISPPSYNAFGTDIRRKVRRNLCSKHADKFCTKHGISNGAHDINATS